MPAKMMVTCVIALFATGCASYVAPGRGANMRVFGPSPDSTVQAALDKKPMASFPCGIAVARVQDAGYSSKTASGWGTGHYSVVFTHDIERDDQIDKIAKLPMVAGLAPMNRLLLPENLQSDLELRTAAANLHADMLLIYTLDTTFNVEDKATPLTVISLGLSPNKLARVSTTASAMLLDTRNGYIYGVASATEKTVQLTSGWTSDDAVDDCRRRVETRAFDKLVGEVEKTWTGVVQRYAGAAGAAPAAWH